MGSSESWASLAAASKQPQPLWAIVASTSSRSVSPFECCLPRAFCISCRACAAEPCPPKSILCSFCHCNRCTRGGPWPRGRHLWANCPRLATRLGRLRPPKLPSGYSLSRKLEPKQPRFNPGSTQVQPELNIPGLNPGSNPGSENPRITQTLQLVQTWAEPRFELQRGASDLQREGASKPPLRPFAFEGFEGFEGEDEAPSSTEAPPS